jgi:uncharacterized protein YciI
MPHFFLKLIPPRPTFATDMTETETTAMQRHADYLAGLLKNGSGIAFGPVFDPRGVFGMGIIEASDEESARTLTDNDPVVQAGIGRYEIYPMRLLQAD